MEDELSNSTKNGILYLEDEMDKVMMWVTYQQTTSQCNVIMNQKQVIVFVHC